MKLLKCGSVSSYIGSIEMKIQKSNFHVNVGSVELEPLSAEEISLLSEKLGRYKSVGADDIPAEVYKNGFPILFCFLACLFNEILGNTFLPREFMKV